VFLELSLACQLLHEQLRDARGAAIFRRKLLPVESVAACLHQACPADFQAPCAPSEASERNEGYDALVRFAKSALERAFPDNTETPVLLRQCSFTASIYEAIAGDLGLPELRPGRMAI